MIAGIRAEHFEDAALAGDRKGGLRFLAKVAVVESMRRGAVQLGEVRHRGIVPRPG